MDEVEDVGAPRDPGRYFAETGQSVSGPFLAFFEHYGATLCGFPISEVRIEDGVRTQYFRNLALEEPSPGRIRIKPLGEAWLSTRAAAGPVDPAPALPVDLLDRLARHPSRRYPTRPLADIRYVVLHHTGAAGDVGPQAIAAEHVEANGWPGIGYHFVVDADGTAFRTQDLTTVTHHTRQFNPVSVGIALMGDLAAVMPTPRQLDRVAALVAALLMDLGLPPEAVRGHREMVPTPCPGDSFLPIWKPRLMRLVGDRLGVADRLGPRSRPEPAEPVGSVEARAADPEPAAGPG